MKITVENIRTNKFNNEQLMVTFNNGAEMEVNVNTLLTDSTTVVYTEKATLKAERFTKKYKEAFTSFIQNNRIDCVTHSENAMKIRYNVFQIGDKIIAHKCHFGTNTVLSVYDWTHYGTIQNAIADMSNTNNWHYQYNFYIISKDMEVTTAKAIASDIVKNVDFELSKSDIENLSNTLYTAIKANSSIIDAYIVDSEKSIHIVRKHADNDYSNYTTHSIYNNGSGDRTTYSGLFRGRYMFPTYESAEFDIRKRAQGGHVYRNFSF